MRPRGTARRTARVRLVTAVAGLSVVAACGSATGPASSSRQPVAHTSSGAVTGAHIGQDLQRFNAIPYAAPPTGALRWQPPQPVQAWKGVKDGTRTAPRCPQNANPADSNPASAAEDCLYLNPFFGQVHTRLDLSGRNGRVRLFFGNVVEHIVARAFDAAAAALHVVHQRAVLLLREVVVAKHAVKVVAHFLQLRGKLLRAPDREWFRS